MTQPCSVRSVAVLSRDFGTDTHKLVVKEDRKYHSKSQLASKCITHVFGVAVYATDAECEVKST